jgi:hypothetical protein
MMSEYDVLRVYTLNASLGSKCVIEPGAGGRRIVTHLLSLTSPTVQMSSLGPKTRLLSNSRSDS